VQTEPCPGRILLTASVYAGLAFLASGFSMFFYPINREKNRQIANELSERRKGLPHPRLVTLSPYQQGLVES